MAARVLNLGDARKRLFRGGGIMKFQYGISPQSLARWATFERICAIQTERGAEVGGSLMRFVVNGELDAIERATVESGRYEAMAKREVSAGS